MTQQEGASSTQDIAQSGGEASIDSILNDIKNVMSSPAQAEPEAEDDVLVLTNEVEKPEPINENVSGAEEVQPGFNPADFGITEEQDILEEIDASFEAKAEPQPQPEVAQQADQVNINSTPVAQEPVSQDEAILDAGTKDTLHGLITHLYKAKKESRHADFRSGTTIEDLVLEILKPELKSWMEQHIVDMVQKVIEKEIRKIMADD